MAEAGEDSKIYELAYHLSPELEEADVKARAQELSDLVAQAGGSVITSLAPRQTHLSYQIKNKQYAHFGILDFAAPSETLEKINARMKLQGNVLRYLLLKKPENKELRILGQHRARPRIKTHETAMPEALKKQPKEKTEAEKQQLEQEVEKVIEGL
ncbi:MAG: 30S ribosomal protein S6 [Candidatus Yanofskybacteria bacterium]|nr:30S ribosomal protein S6 [Candidatus Yanofskybacteria bacterium]